MNSRWEWILAIIAIGASVWARLKIAANWIFGVVFISNEVEFETVTIIIAYLHHLGKISNRQKGTNFFRSVRRHVRPLDRHQLVMEQNTVNHDILFWYSRCPVFYHYANGDNDHCTFSYIRGTFDWKKFLLDVATWEDSLRQREESDQLPASRDRYSITKMFGGSDSDSTDEPAALGRNRRSHRVTASAELSNWMPIHWKKEELGESHHASSLDMLSLRPELVAVVEEARFWRRSEAWYKARGIPWRRSYGFKGAAGTGKTSLSRAIAEDLDLPVFAMDLASMTNRYFDRCWTEAIDMSPCMILMEDVDAVFEGRKNRSNKPDSLTFDCLLQCMDGASRPDGLLLVITTNHIEKLDPALRRAGRMDREVEFLPLDKEGRLKIAMRIVDDAQVAERLVREGEDDPASAFQERCFRLALEQRYKIVA